MKYIIDINGKRWNDSYGNTYHSVAVNILDIETGEEKEMNEPFEYGYSDAYRQTGLKMLESSGMFKALKINLGKLSSWELKDELKRHGVFIRYSVVDVNRKKDL